LLNFHDSSFLTKFNKAYIMLLIEVLNIVKRNILLVTLSCLLMSSAVVVAQVKIIGYVTNNQVTTVDYTKITHLNIAFENPDANGNLSFSGNDNTYILKAHEAGKKVLVSIAGGFASEDATYKARYFDLISDAKRDDFVSKISAYITTHNFDGLDVDLEGSAINADYGKFIAALSTALKANDKLLSTALSHVNGGANVSDETLLLFDHINIMAYDATGPWNPDSPGQHSSYDFAVTSLNYWIGRGLPKSKAILGVPFYGYGFGNDFNEGMAYSEIVNKYAGAEARDESGNTIYYNGIPTIKKKAQYVVDNGYGGIMIWQLAQDLISTNSKSLLRTIYNVINNITTGVTEDSQEAINVYPVPTEETLHIKSEPNIDIEKLKIIDPKGNELAPDMIDHDSINVSGLPAGSYVLRVSNDIRSVYLRFVKQ
jgi:chitinase